MNMIFGAMGPCVWRRALRTAQQTAGAGLHTLGMPGGIMGAHAAAPGPGCPRRCVWHGLDCAIVFDGRLTNRAELRSLAERRGFPLADGDDGELALALYMLFGQECVQMLHGAFALAVFDYQQNILFLARDRLGLAPLWLVRRGPMLAFASRVQPLLALPEIEPVITRQGLGQLILFPAPVGTVFRDVQAFPAGHTAIFRSGSLTLRRSWFLRSRTLLGGEAAETRAETLRRNALDAYGEGGAMLQCPSAPKMPDSSLFAAAVAAADLPGQISPALLALLQQTAGRSAFALADVGAAGLFAPSPEPCDLSLLRENALPASGLPRRPLPPGADEDAAHTRLLRRQTLREVLLPRAACWEAMGRAAGLAVHFPYLDHRLVEYEYNLRTPMAGCVAAEPAAEPLPQSALERLASPQAFLAPVLQPQAVAAALESGQPTPLLHRLALLNAWAEAHALRLA